VLTEDQQGQQQQQQQQQQQSATTAAAAAAGRHKYSAAGCSLSIIWFTCRTAFAQPHQRDKGFYHAGAAVMCCIFWKLLFAHFDFELRILSEAAFPCLLQGKLGQRALLL
jgi:hypothetical protein